MFGIDSKKCKDILQKAGLSSLGNQIEFDLIHPINEYFVNKINRLSVYSKLHHLSMQ